MLDYGMIAIACSLRLLQYPLPIKCLWIGLEETSDPLACPCQQTGSIGHGFERLLSMVDEIEELDKSSDEVSTS